MKRRICVVSGSRADFGPLYWLMKEIQDDPALVLQVIVTGMHLSAEFGRTFTTVEDDGFEIDAKVEMLLSSDSPTGVAKSMGLGLIGFADAIERLRPDILVVLGDRFEILPVAQAALVAGVPVAHVHGGEVTEGAYDDSIRHAVTKLSHLHFVAAPEYARRVLQMGEAPERVFDVGAPGLDQVRRLPLLDRTALEQYLGMTLGTRSFLVTYHPVTLAPDGDLVGAEELLAALDAFPEATVILTGTNADTHGRAIMRRLAHYADANPARARLFDSLGSLHYLSLMRQVDAVIGNSSSGIVEAPFLKTPSVNIGERQKGRLRARSVIDCAGNQTAIERAIRKAIEPEFREICESTVSLYGAGDASRRIKDVLAQFPLEGLVRKAFVDLPGPSSGRTGQ
jgi:GDP/UDP-N,N'-diacetylbacillosamine 2-epimerase (hydrolysing)